MVAQKSRGHGQLQVELVIEKLFFSDLYKNNIQMSIKPLMLKGDCS